MSQNDVELLPCPFCGDDSTDPPWKDNEDFWTIDCDKCMATMGGCPDKADVIENWNRRTPAVLTDGQVEALKAAAEKVSRAHQMAMEENRSPKNYGQFLTALSWEIAGLRAALSAFTTPAQAEGIEGGKA
jgi:Lar family restriction alleviation protein